MNRVYNLIWSKTKERWIVVSEKVKGNGKVPSSPLRSIAVLAAMFASGSPAYALDSGALPTGGQITAGSATISTVATQMTVNQSTEKMIANWQSFNIGSEAAVRFNQPSITSAALNRISDQNPTRIMGSLSANGKVFLLNQSGIVFGRSAKVDVGSLVASSLNTLDSDFLAGNNTFSNAGSAGSIQNQGSINASNGGVVAFIAPKVTNDGTIKANSGSVLLAAGNKVSVDFTGDGLISYTVDEGAVDALVGNSGLVKADGGMVVMTAQAADALTMANATNTGVIEARTIENKGGRILLLSDMENGVSTVSGTLDASAPNGGDGGFIETSGEVVNITDSAHITTVAVNGQIGSFLLDPYDFTIASSGGNITGAALGTALNSNSVTVQTTSGFDSAINLYTSTVGNGDINVTDPVSWSANNTLTLNAYRNININQSIAATGTGSLVLTAGASATIIVAAPINIGGIFNLTSGTWNQAASTLPTFSAHDFRISGGTFIRATGGDGSSSTPYLISDLYGLQGIGSAGMLEKNYTLANDIDVRETSIWNSGAGFMPIGTSDTSFGGKLDGQGKTISNLTINQPSKSYVGLFGLASRGSRIIGVCLDAVNVIGLDEVGALVGKDSKGSITSCKIKSGNVSGNDNIGGLVGWFSAGDINQAASNATVSGNDNIGGLVGWFGAGEIKNGLSNAYVSGNCNVGGLLGKSDVDAYGEDIHSNLYDCSAKGIVSAQDYVGGLVGLNLFSRINSCIAISKVTGSVATAGSTVGGLVGANENGCIYDSYATGDVTGSGLVGGLVGSNYNAAIQRCYATGNVTAVELPGLWPDGTNPSESTASAGGLIAYNENSNIDYCHSSGGVVKGGNYVGGLIGTQCNSDITLSYSSENVIGRNCVGGLVGYAFGDKNTNIAQSYASGNLSCVSPVGLVSGAYFGGLVGLYAKTPKVGDNPLHGILGDLSMVSGAIGFVTAPEGIGFIFTTASYVLTALNFILDKGFNYLASTSCSISNSFALGNVDGYSNVGGLVGCTLGNIHNCYSYGKLLHPGPVTWGGFCGTYVGSPTMDYIYFNKDKNTFDANNKAIGLTATEFKKEKSFQSQVIWGLFGSNGFNFENNSDSMWHMSSLYPVLLGLGEPQNNQQLALQVNAHLQPKPLVGIFMSSSVLPPGGELISSFDEPVE